MTRIVVLDEVELDDRQAAELRELGDVTIYADNPADADEICRRLEGAEVAVLGWTQIDAEILSLLPNLELIAVWATGYDYVDVAAAHEHDVVVTNVPAYAGRAVAEHTLGLILAVTRHIVRADASVRDGSYSWAPFGGFELAGKTLGLVGVGDIGAEVARLASGLGMDVIAVARTMTAEREVDLGVRFADLKTVMSESDIVSLHVPLTPETRGLIGDAELRSMKPGSYLVNTTRAAVVDQAALRQALREGPLAGAGLDEIQLPDDELIGMPNVVLTPHVGFYTREALLRKGDVCVENIAGFLRGTPANIVAVTA
ncbi:MAG TPA: NAD(P)-dependent oxidoreductase [Conexibacter sp.]|nr:NAD(P)-dependent oxidoreductase [Conexibacter sp.]